MKFTIDGELLKKSVNDVKIGIGDGKNIELYSTILVEVNDKIMFQTQDGTIKLTSMTIGDIEEQGEFRCNGNTFIGVISQLSPNDVVEFKTNGDILYVKQKGTTVKFKNVTGFVMANNSTEEDPIADFIVPTDEMAKALSNGMVCVAKENARPTLKGINFTKAGDKLKICSLDGFRLSRSYVAYESETDISDFNVILHTKGVGAIIALCSTCEKVNIKIYPRKVVVQSDNGLIETGLIDGEFFNVDRQFPSMYNFLIKAKKEELKRAVALATITGSGVYNSIDLNFDTDKKILNVESQKDSAESSTGVDIETEQNGSELSIALNSSFLMDIIKNTAGENVIFNIISEAKPIVFTDETSENAFLVLPIRRI